jgi:RNA polymerase sigma-70 factor (ECF subfamily)
MSDQPHGDDQARRHLAEAGTRGLGELFDAYRDRLRGVVMLRLDPRMRGRVDPSDVIQEAFVEAQQRLGDYLNDPKMAPYLWIRFLTVQRLQILYRHHMEAKQRDARREVSLDVPAPAEASSANLAAWIMDSQTTPSEALQRAEQQLQLQQALERMDPSEREVLALRHFEQLGNPEAAEVLGVSPGAASQRYYRALKKLREALGDLADSEQAT